MNTTVQITGQVIENNLIHAKANPFGYKYDLLLNPENSWGTQELEMQIAEFKEDMQQVRTVGPPDAHMDVEARPDTAVKDCHIYFETIQTPRLCNTLKSYSRNEDLRFKWVSVTGNLQKHVDGNVYVAPHTIIECSDPREFNYFEYDGNDDGGMF